ILLSLSFLSAMFPVAASATNNIPQVQHVIIVIQENRTPDNLFNQDSTLVANGAHVQPSYQGNLNQAPPCNSTTGTTGILMTPASLGTTWDTGHNHGGKNPDWENMWDGGKM